MSAVLLLSMFCTSALYAQEHAARKTRGAPDYLAGEEARAAQLYREVLPTVVTILTSTEVFNQTGGREEQGGIGSGVLISPEHHVLTAAHVVAGADEIMLKTRDGKLRPAELLFSESSADIALLRLATPDPDLKHAPLGDSDRLAVGQRVYVIGAPYGLELSFSIGHISAFREFNRLYDGTILAEFIQTDAAINSGNSGGPVFNSRGEVIGIASRILTLSGGSEGLGFVVTINTAKQLLALEDRAWTGLETIFLTGEQLAQLLNLDLEGGLLVQRVARGSPADKAGLRGGWISAQILGRDILLGGDLILELGSQEACHSECLVRAGSHFSGQDQIPVRFLRGGKVMQTVVDVSATRRSFLKASGKLEER
ncbi:MAG: S1C family serine protease [Acidobacteriota bacterium]